MQNILLKKAKKTNIILIENHKIILNSIIPYLSGNDIILIQGAGNIDKIANETFIQKNKKVIT